jgi:hypothetical protein
MHRAHHGQHGYLAGWAGSVLQGWQWGGSGLKGAVGDLAAEGLLDRWSQLSLIWKDCTWCRIGENLQ